LRIRELWLRSFGEPFGKAKNKFSNSQILDNNSLQLSCNEIVVPLQREIKI
jgi:hypothetical protein